MNSLKDVQAAAAPIIAEAKSLRDKKSWDDQDKWRAAHVRSELARLSPWRRSIDVKRSFVANWTPLFYPSTARMKP